MKARPLSEHQSEPAQTVRVPLTPPQATPETSVRLWPGSGRGKAGVLLAHGAGTDMRNPLLVAVAQGLAEQGHPVALFNYGYTQAGRKAPDPMPRLESCHRDVVAWFRARLGRRPLVLGGRSMGGRVASHLAAQGEPCAGLLFLGYPLHKATRVGETPADDRVRTVHWERLAVPALFVQGDRDALADLALLERERAVRWTGAPTTVHVVRGGDHGFTVRKRDGRDPSQVVEEIVEAAVGWLAGLGKAAA